MSTTTTGSPVCLKRLSQLGSFVGYLMTMAAILCGMISLRNKQLDGNHSASTQADWQQWRNEAARQSAGEGTRTAPCPENPRSPDAWFYSLQHFPVTRHLFALLFGSAFYFMIYFFVHAPHSLANRNIHRDGPAEVKPTRHRPVQSFDSMLHSTDTTPLPSVGHTVGVGMHSQSHDVWTMVWTAPNTSNTYHPAAEAIKRRAEGTFSTIRRLYRTAKPRINLNGEADGPSKTTCGKKTALARKKKNDPTVTIILFVGIGFLVIAAGVYFVSTQKAPKVAKTGKQRPSGRCRNPLRVRNSQSRPADRLQRAQVETSADPHHGRESRNPIRKQILVQFLTRPA